jgi:hypothetical protein
MAPSVGEPVAASTVGVGEQALGNSLAYLSASMFYPTGTLDLKGYLIVEQEVYGNQFIVNTPLISLDGTQLVFQATGGPALFTSDTHTMTIKSIFSDVLMYAGGAMDLIGINSAQLQGSQAYLSSTFGTGNYVGVTHLGGGTSIDIINNGSTFMDMGEMVFVSCGDPVIGSFACYGAYHVLSASNPGGITLQSVINNGWIGLVANVNFPGGFYYDYEGNTAIEVAGTLLGDHLLQVPNRMGGFVCVDCSGVTLGSNSFHVSTPTQVAPNVNVGAATNKRVLLYFDGTNCFMASQG